MNYPFTRAVYGFFGGHNLDQSETVHTGLGYIQPCSGGEFAGILDELHHQYDPQIVQAQLNMLSSHDTPRVLTIANGDIGAVRLMFLCQMTVAGAPNIYYGDEIGMPGRHEPDSRRAFPWHGRESWNVALLQDVRRFIALRHATPALRRGDFHVLHAARDVVAYRRTYQGQTAVVAFNRGDEARALTLEDGLPAVMPDALHDEDAPLAPGQAVHLPPRSGRVWVHNHS
jgi:neopullulanase